MSIDEKLLDLNGFKRRAAAVWDRIGEFIPYRHLELPGELRLRSNDWYYCVTEVSRTMPTSPRDWEQLITRNDLAALFRIYDLEFRLPSDKLVNTFCPRCGPVQSAVDTYMGGRPNSGDCPTCDLHLVYPQTATTVCSDEEYERS